VILRPRQGDDRADIFTGHLDHETGCLGQFGEEGVAERCRGLVAQVHKVPLGRVRPAQPRQEAPKDFLLIAFLDDQIEVIRNLDAAHDLQGRAVLLLRVHRQDRDQPSCIAAGQDVERAAALAQVSPPGRLPLVSEKYRVKAAAPQQVVPLVPKRVETAIVPIESPFHKQVPFVRPGRPFA